MNGCQSLNGVDVVRGDIVCVELVPSGLKKIYLIVGILGQASHIAAYPIYGIDDFTSQDQERGFCGAAFIWEGWYLRLEEDNADIHFCDSRMVRVPVPLPIGSVRLIARVSSDAFWAGVITESHLSVFIRPAEHQFAQTVQAMLTAARSCQAIAS